MSAMKSFAAMAAMTPPPPPPSLTHETTEVSTLPVHSIPSGSWSVYYHDPEDPSWDVDSYKKIYVAESWEMLGTILQQMGTFKLMNGLVRIMRGQISPLWEDHANIRGGSYCLKIRRASAVDVFKRYVAAAALNRATGDPSNEITGVTISPKKGFCIIKIWNRSCTRFNSPSDIAIHHVDVRHSEILYRRNTEQRM